MGLAGLIMITLGLRLASKWLDTVQLIAGGLLIIFGFGDILFGWHYLRLAFEAAFKGRPEGPKDIEDEDENQTELQLAEEEAKGAFHGAKEAKRKEKQGRHYRLTPQIAMLQLQAYKPDSEVNDIINNKAKP
ncbi:hypothetical protein P389DRAFT_167660 [Cystobasidium minutum MCA 4210]|uniref:uncharacterized protein n=1 Tax=Cystobasidium minutum MCA 4210 TaxID=1397322 RepID=UPI0034CECCE1|eukprot:jgi/Rhomi1/167660/fgenesh1_kg.2_\